jgi:hypothetical protein
VGLAASAVVAMEAEIGAAVIVAAGETAAGIARFAEPFQFTPGRQELLGPQVKIIGFIQLVE